MSNLLHAVANRPLLVHPGRINDLAAALSPEASRFVGSTRQGQPVRVTENGVAVISIVGPLVNRGALLGENWGISTYEGLQFKLESAAKDPKIRAIILDFESYGGECGGCFELAALIRKINAEKPIYAIVNSVACSAAYALASACRSIISTESGACGSIGVVLLHSDISGALDKAGISPTLIYAGAHKTDANAFEPLSKEVTADLQAEVDRYYSMFVTAVGQGRRNLTEAAIRDTQARAFIGRAAMDAGLVDQIGSFSDLLADLEKSPAARSAVSYPSSTSASGVKKLTDTERYVAKFEGAREEKARIKAILDLPEAVSNPSAARTIAFETSKTVVEAKAELAQGGNFGWEAIADKLNKEFSASQPKRAGSPAQEQKPAQAGAADWSEIAAKLNSERGVSKHGL